MALGPDGDLVAHMALYIRHSIDQALAEYDEMALGPDAHTREHRMNLLASCIAHAAAVHGGDELIQKIAETSTFRSIS